MHVLLYIFACRCLSVCPSSPVKISSQTVQGFVCLSCNQQKIIKPYAFAKPQNFRVFHFGPKGSIFLKVTYILTRNGMPLGFILNFLECSLYMCISLM